MRSFFYWIAKGAIAAAFPLFGLSVQSKAQEHSGEAAQSMEEMHESEVEKALSIFPDVSTGEKLFVKCKSCHMVGKDIKKRMGPPLNGIVGRGAASNEEFKYSKKMTAAANGGLVWSVEELDAFLAAPRKAVAGTSMAFVGVKNPEQRKALIAFLASFKVDGNRVDDLDVEEDEED